MGGMQISLSIVGISTDGPSPVDAFVQNLAKLRDEGFRRVWMAQLPYDADLPTVLAIALREVDTIEVGSAVIPIQVQHPMQLAQRALTLSLIGGGRFTLGIGMSHRMVTEGVWGISWDKPVRQMREYLDGLQPLLDGRARRRLRRILDDPRIAADSRRADAGRVHRRAGPADAAARGPAHGRDADVDDRARRHWPNTSCRRCAERRSRRAAPETAVRVAASLPVSVTDDVDGAREQAAEEFAVYGQLPSYRAMLDREGYAGPEDAAIIGDEQTVSERLDELSAAGVDEFTAAVFDASAGGACAHPGAAADEAVLRPKFLWCDGGHRRTIERTTGSGVTIPKSRQKG